MTKNSAASMNPFEHKSALPDIEKQILDWKRLYPKAYDKMHVDPYTKTRIILMNGIEVEAALFGHNFHRNCQDNDLRRDLALIRRVEQQQQKQINWMSPGDETQLEMTIGYEHLAVDLTAWLAAHEPDPYVKQCMDFALLEDFDHLYRYSNLLKMDLDIPAHKLVQDFVEITPGRPTIAHHRHPFDSVRKPGDFSKAHIQTKLGALILTAGEQQTMNFYMNLGNTYQEEHGRRLFQEIAMVEEQHVTHYGALLDPTCSWLENMLLREYQECYLYWSFYTSEVDSWTKKMWELHFEQEVAHLHHAAELLKKYEGKEWQEVIPDGTFPDLLHFTPMKEYIRDILKNQVTLTAEKENFTDIRDIPENYEFYTYQELVNHDLRQVASHTVIEEFQKENGEDYRSEDKPNPVRELRDRTKDNTSLGRTA